MAFEKLSIIVPVYNEEETINEIIDKIEEAELGVEKEIIIIDDGSTDNTRGILDKWKDKHRIVYHGRNQGKGAAMRTGMKFATGDFIIPQDADTEYDPKDIKNLIELAKEKNAKVVYGSRRLGNSKKKNVKAGWTYYLGGVLLSYLTNLLYGTRITDEPTCYKMIRKDVLDSFNIESNGFEYCPEVTAKIARQKIKIYEVPICYKPRSKFEGKKIKPKDGLLAIWTLIKYKIIK